ncbi:MAG TPA: immunoglobulin domain-containing protein, partial [Ohtaekwangia sp.]|uniref:beta strand repeat-containing protein n=1 Tax=Ohtaekwangia sp. TaxID=2066019 RepID=UPI002F94B194
MQQAFGQCSFTNLNASYCLDDPAFTLTGGTNYYGPGISGTTFTPASSGVGIHKVFTTDGTTSSYTFTTAGTYSPVTMTSPTNVTVANDSYTIIPIGFTFQFYGTNFTNVRVSDNGYVRFSGTTITSTAQTIPDATTPNNLIAVAWDDLNPSTGTIRYKLVGSAPLRRLVIEYNNVQFTSAPAEYVTAQIHLYETLNIIEIHSAHIGSDGSAKTMGIENAAGSAAVAATGRNNQVYTANNDYVAFVPSCTEMRNVTVYALPSAALTVTPASTTICSGSTAAITVGSSVAGINYQLKNSSTNAILSSSYAGTGGNLVLTSNAISANVTVKVTATNATTGCDVDLTNTTNVSVNALPAITTHPSSQTLCEGSNASFSVSATGAGITYQWQVDTGSGFTNLGGQVSSTLSLAAVTSAMNGNQYRVVVSGTCTPSVTSNAATLTVQESPEITGQPGNSIICQNANTSFTVNPGVTTSPTYQWQVSTNGGSTFSNVTNGGVYSGATAATLNLTNVPVTYNGYLYKVTVSGTCSSPVTSSGALLTVNNNTTIVSSPVNTTVCELATVQFTVSATGNALTYQWQENGVNITDGGIYSGATTATLTLSGVSGTLSGKNYKAVVSSSCGGSQTSGQAILTVREQPEITSQPAGTTICEGSNTSFTVNAGVTYLPVYAWEVSTNGGSSYSTISNGGIYSGATTATLSLTNVPLADNGYLYRAVVSGGCTPAVTSNVALLTVNQKPSITTSPTPQTVCAGSSATFTVVAAGTNLTYQWRKGGVNIGGATSSSYTIASTVAGDAGSYDVVVSGTCTPPITSSAATLIINALPAITVQPTASQAICEGSSASFSVTATGTGLTYQWKKNGVDIAGANASTYTIATTATADAGTYTVVVSGTCSPSVTSTASVLTIQEQPEIITGPVSQTVCAGQSVTFSVNAGVTTGVSYQWRKGGVNIGGATSSSYTIASTVAGDAGSYDVVVSGTCTPSVTSTAATLTINDLPAITAQPTASQAICEGSSASFSVTATGTGLTYQWKKNGVDISGANASTYTIATTVTADAGTYTVVVSGTCSPSVTSTASVLTIQEQPEIITGPVSQTVCAGQSVTFSVNAGVTTGVSYQWRKGGVNIVGATSSSYTIASTVAGDAGSYDVIVSGTCTPPITSAAAALTVNPNPDAYAPDASICSGQITNITITNPNAVSGTT